MTERVGITRRAVTRSGGGRDRSRRRTVRPRRAVAAEPIKIGMPLALTGPLGSVGQQLKRGGELWAKSTERQGRADWPADPAADRGYRRQPGRRGAQSAGNGGARRLQYLHRHHLVVRGAGGGAEARRVEGDLRFLRQWRREAHRGILRAQFFPLEHLGADGRAGGVALPAGIGVAERLCHRHGLCLGPQQRAGLRSPR